MSVQKTTVVKYYGSVYTTPRGFAGMVADRIVERILERIRCYHPNRKKYGDPSYRNLKDLDRWKENRKRLRAKCYRRIFPIIERLWK